VRRRLLVTILSIVALVLVGLGVPLGWILGVRAQQQAFVVRQGDTVRFATLAQPLLAGQSPDRRSLEAALARHESIRGVETAVIGLDGGVVAASPGLSVGTGLSEVLTQVLPPEQVQTASGLVADALVGRVSTPPSGLSWGAVPLLVAEAVRVDGQPQGAVLTVSATRGLWSRVLTWWAVLGAVAVAVLAVAVLLVLPVVRWVLRPVAALDAATGQVADAVTAGHVAEPVREESGPGELRRLTHSFDRMAATVSEVLAGQRAFVADASHQLRNPLTALRLRLQLLDPCLDGPLGEHYLAAVEETDRLATILDDLLTLARAEATTTPATANVVAVDDAVADRVDAWQAVADAHDIQLRHRRAGHSVRAPDAVLPMALDALLDNALKFTTAPGAVEIDTQQAGEHVEVAVRDTGPGLAGDELDRATDRFWRSSSSQNVPGSGLGLAIVQRTLRSAGGDVRLERPPDGGLRVVLVLPAADASALQEYGTDR
jgi:signal transduction histidine kinase